MTFGAAGLALLLALFPAQGKKPDFFEATTEPDRPQADRTIGGKSVAAIKAAVAKEWSSLTFEKAGKQLDYTVKFDTDDGEIVVGFYPDKAPNHARSFILLAKNGYFDGLVFHRCIKDFMIQGGCPLGTGSGGPGYQLKAEFNDLPHGPGVLSAARSGDPDSAGSQFFLCLTRERTAHLDNEYSVFGKVRKGMDVVEKIVARPTRGNGETPIRPAKIKKATVEVAEKDKEPAK